MSFARRSVNNVPHLEQVTDDLEGTCFNDITQCMARTKLDSTKYQLPRA